MLVLRSQDAVNSNIRSDEYDLSAGTARRIVKVWVIDRVRTVQEKAGVCHASLKENVDKDDLSTISGRAMSNR